MAVPATSMAPLADAAPAAAAPDAMASMAMPLVPPDAGVPDAAVQIAVPTAAPDAGLLLGLVEDEGADEVEPDPETAADPDPASLIEPADPENEDEAPDAPAKVVDEVPDPKVPPPPTLAKTTDGAVQLIRAGRKELALQSLRRMWPKKKKSAYIPFLLGNLYTDKKWWSVALDHYRIAIRKNKAYKRNGTLNRNVIRMLASKKTMKKASLFLRKTIGRPAKPHVKACAKHNKSITLRKRCAAVARMIR